MKKEKKKGSCLKTILIAFGILIVLGAIASAFGDDSKESDDNTSSNISQSESEPTSNNTNNQPEEAEGTENNESLSTTTLDDSNESESESDPLGFNVTFSKTYRNDTTGNWRLARIAENINIEEYAVDYYNNYFESDTEVHIIINFSLNTTTCITVMGNLLDVTIMEYVDKEEHDAVIACTGTLLKEYHVNIDTGEIEEIQ